MNFGDFIHNRRIELGYTLREFCRKKGQDTAYISRIENNLTQPPKNQIKLEALALAYEFEANTKEWVEFFDLAAASQLTIPKDLTIDNPEIIKFLPAFYRTARKKNLDKKDIEKLLKILKGEDSEPEQEGN